MNYRSVKDLNLAIKQWIPDLPKDLDLIVGIPRSGLLVANLLSLYLNLPLTDVDGLIDGRLLQSDRRGKTSLDFDSSQPLTILVVDDSVRSGKQMQQVQARVKTAGLQHQIYYAAVYAVADGRQYLDFWYEIVETPRIFEWNVMHHLHLANSCVDIDGVLCRDPSDDENDDGEQYAQFLAMVPPLVVPTYRIGWLVTCRLEKYRAATEDWLTQHNVRYDHLVMMDLPDKAARQARGNHAVYKAEVYKSVGAALFIESSYRQAVEIARLSGRSVFCVETGEMIQPDLLAKGYSTTERIIRQLRKDRTRALLKAPKFIKKLARRLRRQIQCRLTS